MPKLPAIKHLAGKHQTRLKPILFVAAFALIGVTALIITKAATPTASFEAEAGTIATGACSVSDAGASGSSAVKFGSCGGGGSLPAGVTLQDIDGGQTYFEQWTNSFPSAREDPTFFPIAIFNNYDIANKAVAYKNMGVNTFVGLYNGVLSGSPNELTVAKNNGMYALGGPESTASALSSYGSTMAGYMYQDEAENNTCAKIDVAWLRAYCTPTGSSKPSTASFITMTNQMHLFDPTRPVYNGYTNGFAFDWFLNGNAEDLAEGSDIVGYDVYPLVDRRSTFGGQMTTGKVWGTYQTVALSRGHANYNKPIWPDIETSQVDTFNNTCYRPTGADVKSLVWNGIVAGARGITYFNANFAGNCSSPTMGTDVLLHTHFSDIRTAVTEVNAQVKSMAPAINAQFANGYETHTGTGINTMTKYCNSGVVMNGSAANCTNKFYIFATPKAAGSQTVTFTVKSGTSVTVEGESRTIPITGGQFTDTFATEITTHIYRIN